LIEAQPYFTFLRQVVAWSVIDDQKYFLSAISAKKHFQKYPKRITVENISDLIAEARLIKTYRTK
jgi:hypothetical protein